MNTCKLHELMDETREVFDCFDKKFRRLMDAYTNLVPPEDVIEREGLRCFIPLAVESLIHIVGIEVPLNHEISLDHEQEIKRIVEENVDQFADVPFPDFLDVVESLPEMQRIIEVERLAYKNKNRFS